MLLVPDLTQHEFPPKSAKLHQILLRLAVRHCHPQKFRSARLLHPEGATTNNARYRLSMSLNRLRKYRIYPQDARGSRLLGHDIGSRWGKAAGVTLW